jgi:hypothetical protein
MSSPASRECSRVVFHVEDDPVSINSSILSHPFGVCFIPDYQEYKHGNSRRIIQLKKEYEHKPYFRGKRPVSVDRLGTVGGDRFPNKEGGWTGSRHKGRPVF